MNRFIAVILILHILWIHAPVFSQTDLEKTRREIERLEREIKKKQTRESSLMDQIEDVNREIGLRKKLLINLNNEKIRNERDIRQTELRLQQAREEEATLKDLIGRRMVSIYKRGRKSDWEMLLTLSSVNQALVWVRYQKLILENDKRNLRLLREKQNHIEQEAGKLEQDLKAKELLIRTAQDEANTLEDRRKARETLLVKVRDDAGALREKLEDRRRAYSQIAKRIQREQAQIKPGVPGHSVIGDGTEFARLKGKMGWPVSGEVVTKYGRQHNPVLKTDTYNLGIDIESAPNAAITPPCLGVVKWVTWQRGMGNLVLVDHGGDYYTVYGYLDMVLVDTGTEIDTQSIIGYVGDRGGLYGSNLHFEVWKGTEHQNPLLWLQ
ncbi:peptidoglycan DD-metalloendopeptidase family protein [bacterium]|nr:peptidoglycan DD-metalloendopeptidase family protein [bacterium]